mgnify:CR=1 FL=1
MQKETRPVLLSGLIICLVVFSVLCLVFFIVTLRIAAIGIGRNPFFSTFDIGFSLALFVLLLTFSIFGIVFSANSIPLSSKPLSALQKNRGYILTTFIFATIIDIIFLLSILDGVDRAINILLFLALTAGATLTLVGYIIISNQESGSVQQSNIMADDLDILYNKMERLNKLKEMSVVTEEEYQDLRQKYVAKLKK